MCNLVCGLGSGDFWKEMCGFINTGKRNALRTVSTALMEETSTAE